MLLKVHKILVFFVLISCLHNVWAEEQTANIVAEVGENNVPETLAVEVQGHENTSERKVRQFGFPPPPPYGFGGYRPGGFYGGGGFPGGGGFYGGGGFPRGGGFSGGGFQRSRVVTQTRTRIVDRYQGGGFRGGFYG